MKILNPGFCKLVSILNDGHYHDGTRIGETLAITRSAVWKAIKKLQAYDIKIDSVKGKGYALLEPLILLNKATIKKNIAHKNCEITVYESIDSTNNVLKTATKSNKVTISIAEQQTQGKGRLNRAWHSPFGQNIYLSCSYPFHKDVSELSGLSLVISLAIVKALEFYRLLKPVQVKWPNDILYDQQKLCGNLIEIQAESHGACHAIIGIGLNVNMMTEDQGSITQAWTSLRKISGTYIDRNELCVFIINHLITYLEKFEKQGLEGFIDEWNEVDCLFKKEVALKNNQQVIYGKAMGIDHLGHLILKLKDGSTRSFSSGDTSVVK